MFYCLTLWHTNEVIMATKVKLSSGLIAWHCSEKEIQQTWDMFDKYDKEVLDPNYIHKTNDRFELPYNQIKETFDKSTLTYHLELLANGKNIKVRGKIEKLNDNINKAVRRAFNI